MRRRFVGVGLVAALLSSACYESAVPLDATPQGPVDRALLGTWRCLPIGGARDDAAATMAVTFPEARVYGIDWTEDGGQTNRYRAFASSVMSRLLNVQDVGATANATPWTFVRYTMLRPGVLFLQVASDDVLKDVRKTPAALRQAIDRLQTAPSLFADFGVCARTKQ